MENIIYELNGIKYLLTEVLIESEKQQEELNDKIKFNGYIYQGIKSYTEGGFFSKQRVIIRVLIPEKTFLKNEN